MIDYGVFGAFIGNSSPPPEILKITLLPKTKFCTVADPEILKRAEWKTIYQPVVIYRK